MTLAHRCEMGVHASLSLQRLALPIYALDSAQILLIPIPNNVTSAVQYK
jgi:hypothetical protein